MSIVSQISLGRLFKACIDSLTFGANSAIARSVSLTPPLRPIYIPKTQRNFDFEPGVSPSEEVVVQIDPDFALHHEFTANITNRRDLHSTVELEAERLFPVHLDNIVTAYSVEKQSDGKSSLISVVGVRKKLIDQVEESARRRGVDVASVELKNPSTGARLHFNLDSARRKRRGRLTAAALLGFTSFLLLDAMPGIYLGRIEAEIAVKDQKIAEERKNTSTIASLQSQINQMQTLASEVYTEINKGNVAEIVAQIAAASPDDVVIDELRIDRDSLYMTGRALAPEDWLISLGRNAAISNATLTAIAQNANTNKQRFELRASVVWPSQRQGVS